jgi:hypothetical protein
MSAQLDKDAADINVTPLIDSDAFAEAAPAVMPIDKAAVQASSAVRARVTE